MDTNTKEDQEKKYKSMELRVHEAEANMRKAAKYGQHLISELSELKLLKEQGDQEIYELKNRLDACLVLERAVAEDTEALKEANAKLMNDKEIAELQSSAKICKLVDEYKVEQLKYEETIQRLEKSLESTSEQLVEANTRLNQSTKHWKEDSPLASGKYYDRD